MLLVYDSCSECATDEGQTPFLDATALLTSDIRLGLPAVFITSVLLVPAILLNLAQTTALPSSLS